jgi:hypothetical protein
MPLRRISKRIADKQIAAYLIAFLLGSILYTLILYMNDWNVFSVILDVFSVEVSAVTGIILRFISGLGLALTYTTFCALVFGVLAPSLKGRKMAARVTRGLLLIPTIVLILYAFYRIGGAIFLLRELTEFELLTTIFGVWSLVVLVYVIPSMKEEYRPEIDQSKGANVKEKVSDWKFSLLRGYRSHISRDYGRVYESDFQRYGARLARIRVILSGFLLLPIAFLLVTVTPLAIVSVVLWIRLFSIDHKDYSKLERGLLILATLCVALLTTVTFFQSELVGFRIFFDVSYGIGLLTGIVLLFVIML